MMKVLRHLRDNLAVASSSGSSVIDGLIAMDRVFRDDRRHVTHLRNTPPQNDVYPAPHRTQSAPVNLQWWSYREDPNLENFGDALSSFIVSAVAHDHGIDAGSGQAHGQSLCAIGSIIGQAAPGSVIWGTGYEPTYDGLPAVLAPSLKFDVRAVRGPLTRWELIRRGVPCPPIYGDPAVLLPQYFPVPASSAEDIVVVPHHRDEKTRSEARTANLPVVHTLAADWHEPVTRIAQAKLVLSSSLHGIIVAESYGVPAIRLVPPDATHSFKFDDYYLSTGRPDYPVARSFEEAARLEPAPVPDFTVMRRRLRDAFPYDLWV